MELREQELRTSIQSREVDLNVIENKLLESSQRLRRTEFDLIRQKIATRISGVIITTLSFRVQDEYYSPKGIRPRRVELWSDYLRFIRETAAKLPNDEQALGQAVVQNFIEQCAHLSKVTINLPAIRGTVDVSTDKMPKELEAIQSSIERARTDIEKCFNEVQQRG